MIGKSGGLYTKDYNIVLYSVYSQKKDSGSELTSIFWLMICTSRSYILFKNHKLQINFHRIIYTPYLLENSSLGRSTYSAAL